MFKTTGTIDKAFFDEIKRFFLSKSMILVLIIDLAFFVLLGVSAFIDEIKYINSVLILGAVFITFEFISRPNKFVRLNLERMAETTGKRVAEYEVYFEDDVVVSHNLESGSISRVEYGRLSRFKKS